MGARARAVLLPRRDLRDLEDVPDDVRAAREVEAAALDDPGAGGGARS